MGTSGDIHSVDASWAQTGVLAINHALAGADRVYEQVTGATPVMIPRAGIWEVDYNARASVSIPGNTAANLWVITALFKNGVPIAGTDAISGISTAAAPAASQQETQGHSFVHSFTAGDVVTLHACRLGQVGNASVISNGDGRTRITAHWLGPVGDSAG